MQYIYIYSSTKKKNRLWKVSTEMKIFSHSIRLLFIVDDYHLTIYLASSISLIKKYILEIISSTKINLEKVNIRPKN